MIQNIYDFLVKYILELIESLVLLVPPVFHRVTNREAAWGLGHEGDDKEDMTEKREVVLGHPVSLSCESNAIPPPKLSWYKDGRKLTSADGVVLRPGLRELLPLRSQLKPAVRLLCWTGVLYPRTNGFILLRWTGATNHPSTEGRCWKVHMPGR